MISSMINEYEAALQRLAQTLSGDHARKISSDRVAKEAYLQMRRLNEERNCSSAIVFTAKNHVRTTCSNFQTHK